MYRGTVWEMYRGLHVQSKIEHFYLLYLCYTLNKYRNQSDPNHFIRKPVTSYYTDTHTAVLVWVLISCPLIVEPPFKPLYLPDRCHLTYLLGVICKGFEIP